MTEGPGAVAVGAFGGGGASGLGLTRRQLFGVDQVVGHQDLGIELVLEILWGRTGQDVESILRLGELAPPACTFGTFGVIGAVSDEFGQLVQ
ncbi:UNVERIFIED_ORG: hypothetical protein L601_003900000270 [Gordonia westfalica J30]